MDENNPVPGPVPNGAPLTTPPAYTPMLCPQCHLPVPPEFYFCPNCGAKLRLPPLSTSIGTQAWIYIFSAILPVICYLAISYWPGIKYIRSDDPRAKQIGIIAAVILTISSVITFWLGIIWIQQFVQSQVNSVNGLL